MDVPMEDCEDGNDNECSTSTANQGSCSSSDFVPTDPNLSEETSKRSSWIIRNGGMVMMTITMEEYETQYWPKLKGAIEMLLVMKPQDKVHISYEQMYSCVYKCVCKQYAERLFQDLVNLITDHLEQMRMNLNSNEPKIYIESFHYTINQYLQALAGIVPIFNYMNRFFVQNKLKSDLNVILRNLFVTIVAEKHIETLIPMLVDASLKPFYVPPNVMAMLIKQLYELKPEFSLLRPQLFARYIPNVLPPSRPEDLDVYIEEVRRMQRDLRTHPDFICGDQTRKRSGEDDISKTPSMGIKPKDCNT